MLDGEGGRECTERLTALAIQRAMAQGAKVICLTAADERVDRKDAVL